MGKTKPSAQDPAPSAKSQRTNYDLENIGELNDATGPSLDELIREIYIGSLQDFLEKVENFMTLMDYHYHKCENLYGKNKAYEFLNQFRIAQNLHGHVSVATFRDFYMNKYKVAERFFNIMVEGKHVEGDRRTLTGRLPHVDTYEFHHRHFNMKPSWHASVE